jgi:hypothetical protein
MKSLFLFLIIAIIPTAIKGYSEDDHWKDFKVNDIVSRNDIISGF